MNDQAETDLYYQLLASDQWRAEWDELLANDPGYDQWITEQEHNMDINDTTPLDDIAKGESKYLKKDDVGEGGLIVTIQGLAQVDMESDDGRTEHKTIIKFMEDLKPMVLNQTNRKILQTITGAQTVGDLKGKQVVVYNDPTVSFGGRVTGGLRIKAAQSAAPQAAPSRAADPDHPDVPF